MKLRHSRELIVHVAARWKRQYPTDKADVTAKLEALDPATATAAQVAAIIGNTSWSHFTCQECSQPHERAVDLSGDYGGGENLFCASCLRAAAALASVVIP